MTTRLTYELSRVSLPKMLYGRITVVLHLELYGNFCITNVFFRCLFDPMKTPGFAWLPKEFGDSFPLCPFYLRSAVENRFPAPACGISVRSDSICRI